MSVQKVTLYGGQVEVEFNDWEHTYDVVKAPGLADPPLRAYGASSISKVPSNPNPLIYWALNCAETFFRQFVEMTARECRERGIDPPHIPLDEIVIERVVRGMKFAHRETLDDAANLGTLVHSYINDWSKAGAAGTEAPPFPVNEDARGHCAEFLKWAEQARFVPVRSERPVFSLRHCFAGTLDLQCEVGGKPAIVDIKVSSGIYDEHRLQTAGYRLAAMEEDAALGKPVDYERWLLLLNKKTGKFQAERFDHHAEDEAAFLAAAGLYKWINWRRDKCPADGRHFAGLGNGAVAPQWRKFLHGRNW